MKNRGISLIEIIIVIAIIGIISAVSFSSISNSSRNLGFEKSLNLIVASIERARTLTINSSNFSSYGLKIDSNEISLFEGTSFASSSIEETYDLDNNISISNVDFESGSNIIYFSKLTGNANTSGTITLSSSISEETKDIFIYNTGIVDIQ